MAREQMRLSWNKFSETAEKAFRDLGSSGDFSDVTLTGADGKFLEAHLKLELVRYQTQFRDASVSLGWDGIYTIGYWCQLNEETVPNTIVNISEIVFSSFFSSC